MKNAMDNKKVVSKKNGAVGGSKTAAGTEKKGGIPPDDKEFVPWGGNFSNWVGVNVAKLGWTTAQLSIFEGHYSDYAGAVGKLEGGNSSALLLAERDAAKALFVADCQGLIDYELKNPLFTKADLIAAGVYVPDRANAVYDTQIFESPVLELQNRERNVIRCRTRCENSTHFRMPVDKHYRNVEYCGKVLASESSATPTVEECNLHGFSSTSGFTRNLGEGNSGKYIVIYVRYTNHFPIPGPWSGSYGGTIL